MPRPGTRLPAPRGTAAPRRRPGVHSGAARPAVERDRLARGAGTPDGPARGHLSARDPVTGAKKWEVNFKQPPLASCHATIGPMSIPDVLDAVPPALSPADAETLTRAAFDVVATAESLVSERDQNFRLTDVDGAGWVLKVSNAAEDPGVVAMEVAAIEHIAAVDPGLPVPVARRSVDGEAVAPVTVAGTPACMLSGPGAANVRCGGSDQGQVR